MKACILPSALPAAAFEVAGLPVPERSRRGLVKAGFRIVPPDAASEGPVLFVRADAVVDPEAARRLWEAAAAGAAAAADSIEAPAALALPAAPREGAAPRHAEDLAPLAAGLGARARLLLPGLEGSVCERVASAEAARRLETRMRVALVRPTDGFFARHFDRRISSRLSLHLVRHGITPNAITLVATAVGLLAAALLATQSHALHVLGALLFIASTVLDGCDGEVARLSFTSSEFGRRLDLVGDNLVNAAVFVAIGWGAIHATEGGAGTALVLVTLSGFALATLAGWSFIHWAHRTGRGERYNDFYERLASRDFAYFVLLLALLDRLHGFLWFAAVGSYVFVAVLLAIRLSAGRGPRPPAAPAGEEQWA